MDELPLHRTNRLRDGFNFYRNKQCKAEIMKRGREKVSNSALEVNLATDKPKHNLAGL